MGIRCGERISSSTHKTKDFETLQGHVLVMHNALYGTRSLGACRHDKHFDILHEMGFKPSNQTYA